MAPMPVHRLSLIKMQDLKLISRVRWKPEIQAVRAREGGMSCVDGDLSSGRWVWMAEAGGTRWGKGTICTRIERERDELWKGEN